MHPIFSFDDPKEVEEWFIINDGVMGGLSESNLKNVSDGVLRFSGYLSMENNGGFASCRSRPNNLSLDDFSGIELSVKGDGRTYSFRLRTDNNYDGVAYVQEFETIPGKWLTVNLPFEKFVPQFRGRIIRNYQKLNPSSIAQLGFMISDKKEGSFVIEVDYISAI